MWAIEAAHVDLAREISTVAREHGATGDLAAVQEVQVAVAAKPDDIDLGFWRAVLGYEALAPDNGLDPLGHSSTVWMQDLDVAKPLRHAMHIDVSVPREHAEARLQAALAAGGRIVDVVGRPGGLVLAAEPATRCASRPGRTARSRRPTRRTGRGPAMTQALRELGTRIDGDVVLPDDETWDAARQSWNLAVDQRPVAVVYPETAADVVATVRVAAEHGLRIAFNAGGHNAGPDRLDAATRSCSRPSGCAASRSTPSRGARARRGGRPRRSRSRWPPASTASPTSPARRPTSASWATRSAAGSAGWSGRTAWPATRSSPPTS